MATSVMLADTCYCAYLVLVRPYLEVNPHDKA